jgi:lysophospholipase L1-like esterase
MTSSTGADPPFAPVPPGWPGDDPTLPEDVDGPAPAHAARPESADEPEPTGTAGGDDDDGGYRPAHARPRREAAARSLATRVDAPGLDTGDQGIGDDDDTGDLDVDPSAMGAVGVAGLDPDTEPDDIEEPDDGPEAGPDGGDDGDAGDAGIDPGGLDDLVAGVQPAGRVLVIMVASLLLAMLINADDLVERAEQRQPGAARDRSLAIWHPVQDVSHALQLHRVRELADWLVGEDGDDRAGGPPPSGEEARGEPGGRDIDDERVGGVASAGDDDGTGPGAASDADDDDDGDGGRRGPGGATGDEAQRGTGTQATRVPRATGDAVRSPTADAPLRLWVGGDAMAEMFGRSLVRVAEDTGLVEGTLHYEMASGLTRPDYYDWPDALADDLDDHDPEVVVMIVGTNDGQGIVLDDGTPVPEVSDPRWLPEYRRRVGALMDLLHADGRIVFWVGQPPMLDPDYDARIDVINQAYAAEAATRPWITFVDSTVALGDPSGAFADALPDPAGTPVDVRRDDGIHLTAEGADRLASHVLGIIAARVDLSGTAG